MEILSSIGLFTIIHVSCKLLIWSNPKFYKHNSLHDFAEEFKGLGVFYYVCKTVKLIAMV